MLLVDAILCPLSLVKARNLHGLLGYLILRQRKLSFTLLHIPMSILTAHPNTLFLGEIYCDIVSQERALFHQ